MPGLPSLLGVVCAYALTSLTLITSIQHHWHDVLEESLAPVEALHRAREHLLKAMLHAERLTNRSQTASRDLVVAELATALAEGEHVAVTGADDAGPALHAAVDDYVATLRQVHTIVLQSIGDHSIDAALELRMAQRRIDQAEQRTEAALQERLQQQSSRQDQWTVLTLLLVGGLGIVLMLQLALAHRQRETTLAALRESEASLRGFAQALPDLSFILDADGRYIEVFGGDSALLVAPAHVLRGRRLHDFFTPAQVELFLSAIRRALDGSGTVRCEYELTLDGQVHWFEGRVGAVPDQRLVVWLSREITQQKQAEARLRHMAHYDPLTDLPNRLLVLSRLEHALAIAQRERHNVAVLFIDLDNFKTVNDSLGHGVGDELLGAVATRLARRTRRQDTLGRLGGDEFILLLEHLREPGEAANVAQELLRLLQAPFHIGRGQEVFVQASIGISVYPDDGLHAEELVRDADAAMYQAKQAGRGTFRYYTESLTTAARSRLTLDTRLRHAIDNHEFELWYQPIFSLPGQQLIGFEALARLHQPGQPAVGPTEFIPVLEESGLITALGDWVTHEACRQGQAWLNEGLEFGRIAVNLSPVEVRRGGIPERIRNALEASGLPAERLELELTESGLMEQGVQAERLLDELRGLGVHIAIDDFGTGYSSLAYLKRFAVDRLKIDRSFVCDVGRESSDDQLVRTMVALGRNLGIAVLAEGVETGAQLVALNQLGCQAVQGYWTGPPRPASQARQWMLPDRHDPGTLPTIG